MLLLPKHRQQSLANYCKEQPFYKSSGAHWGYIQLHRAIGWRCQVNSMAWSRSRQVVSLLLRRGHPVGRTINSPSSHGKFKSSIESIESARNLAKIQWIMQSSCMMFYNYSNHFHICSSNQRGAKVNSPLPWGHGAKPLALDSLGRPPKRQGCSEGSSLDWLKGTS